MIYLQAGLIFIYVTLLVKDVLKMCEAFFIEAYEPNFSPALHGALIASIFMSFQF